MFQTPKPSTSYVAPAEPIDANQRYMLKVEELIDLGPSKFPNPGDDPDNPTHRIQWKFLLADMDGNKILDVEGEPYRHYDYTSSKTGKSTRAGGKTATARMWMEAFFGKALEDDEIGPDIANDLRGKVAVALFEQVEKESQSGEAYTQLKILRLSPRRATKDVLQAQRGGTVVATVDTSDPRPEWDGESLTQDAQAARTAASQKAQATVARARTAVATPPEEPEGKADLPW